jgi:hypothetical protein
MMQCKSWYHSGLELLLTSSASPWVVLMARHTRRSLTSHWRMLIVNPSLRIEQTSLRSSTLKVSSPGMERGRVTSSSKCTIATFTCLLPVCYSATMYQQCLARSCAHTGARSIRGSENAPSDLRRCGLSWY